MGEAKTTTNKMMGRGDLSLIPTMGRPGKAAILKEEGRDCGGGYERFTDMSVDDKVKLGGGWALQKKKRGCGRHRETSPSGDERGGSKENDATRHCIF